MQRWERPVVGVESAKANCSILLAWQQAWKPEAFWGKAKKRGPRVGVGRRGAARVGERLGRAFTSWVTANAQLIAFPGMAFCIQRRGK